MPSTQKSEPREQPLNLVEALRLRNGMGLPKKTLPKYVTQKTIENRKFSDLSILSLN
jgi:hypothetical protein